MTIHMKQVEENPSPLHSKPFWPVGGTLFDKVEVISNVIGDTETYLDRW